MFTLIYADETSRDAAVAKLKYTLRSSNVKVRVVPVLTQLQITNKSIIYDHLKELPGIKLIDWGNKVVVIVTHSNGTEHRQVV